jgi:CheY-like chemotaxis protein
MAVPPPFPENIKIVLVDDRPDFRLLIAQYLARRGARVFTAKNAIEGLGLVREIRPEVVLSDINMPGRSGFELLADIRSLDRENGGRVPVIAVTAYRQEYDVIIGAGFQAYLRKPFTPSQLVAIIDSVLES